jgi:hypothetical protein
MVSREARWWTGSTIIICSRNSGNGVQAGIGRSVGTAVDRNLGIRGHDLFFHRLDQLQPDVGAGAAKTGNSWISRNGAIVHMIESFSCVGALDT